MPHPASATMPITPTYKIHFSDPIPQVIHTTGKKYYMQLATNNGQDILICSEWFRSDGLKPGIDKKPEILFKTAGKCRDALNVIENEAIRQLRMPPEVLSELGLSAGQLENKALYKPLHKGEFMYAKLHRDCSFFNAKRESIKNSDLAYGDYRVVIAVKGLYIGSHSENGTKASLHVRIFQLQYREVNVACLFDGVTGMLTNGSQIATPSTSQPPPPPQPAQASTAGRKNGRKNAKPPMMRQNEMVIEGTSAAALESLPPDFFNDFNI